MNNLKQKALHMLRKFRMSGANYLDASLINGFFGRNVKGPLVGAFIRMLPACGLGATKFRVGVICMFVSHCFAIYKFQGMKGLVIRLKAATVLLQQSLAWFVLSDVTPLGCRVARGSRGIPRLIPYQHRCLLQAGDTSLMRFYLTLFNVYRVLEMPGKLKMGSITAPFSGAFDTVYFDLIAYIVPFVALLRGRAGDRLKSGVISPGPILKSAPGTGGPVISTHPLILMMSAGNLKRVGLDSCIIYFMNMFKCPDVRYPGILRLFLEARDSVWTQSALLAPSGNYALGRLGFKAEAAGKVRVFAMVDAWTQWVLEPLHLEIFRILKFLPADGTFDQLAPVRKYVSWPSAYSLDLTAATDRVPLSLQIALLSSLYGSEFATMWGRLLVDRDYDYYNKTYAPEGGTVRYSVGQPMGALSSWAMLALTHHFIVHCAAWRSGLIPVGSIYSNYAVLGDDLVLGDRVVKDAYLTILKTLGVECGLHKSVLSSRGVGIEFAKKTLINGVDVSPVPVAEFLAANLSLPSALAFGAKYSLTPSELVKTLGYGYRVLGSLSRHVGRLNARVRAVVMGYLIPVSGDSSKLVEFLGKGNPISRKTESSLFTVFTKKVWDRVASDLSRSMKFHLGTFVKSSVVEVRNNFFDRFGTIFLQHFVPVESGAPGALVPSTGPAKFSWKWPPKGEANLPPDVFNRVEDSIRSFDQLLTQLHSLILGGAFGRARDAQFALQGELSRLQGSRTLAQMFGNAVETLKLHSDLPNVALNFHRHDPDVRNILTVKELQLWKTWSEMYLLSIKTAAGSPLLREGPTFALDDDSPAAIQSRVKAEVAMLNLKSRFID